MVTFQGGPNVLARLVLALVFGVGAAVGVWIALPQAPAAAPIQLGLAAWVFGTFVRSGLDGRQVWWRLHLAFLPLVSGRIDLTGFRHFEIGTQSIWGGGPSREEVRGAAYSHAGKVTMGGYAVVFFAKLIAGILVPWTVPPREVRGRNRDADEVTLWRGWSHEAAEKNLFLIQQSPTASRQTPASGSRARSAAHSTRR